MRTMSAAIPTGTNTVRTPFDITSTTATAMMEINLIAAPYPEGLKRTGLPTLRAVLVGMLRARKPSLSGPFVLTEALGLTRLATYPGIAHRSIDRMLAPTDASSSSQ